MISRVSISQSIKMMILILYFFLEKIIFVLYIYNSKGCCIFVFYAFPKILSDITVAFEIAEYYSSLRLLCPGFLYPFVQRRSIIETHSAPRGEELVAETLGLERSSRNQLSRISYLSSFENTFVKTHKIRETAT